MKLYEYILILKQSGHFPNPSRITSEWHIFLNVMLYIIYYTTTNNFTSKT